MEAYDIVIAGAGISGLILAKELSKEFSVLVIEKAQENKNLDRFWLTPKACLDKNPSLVDCIDNTYKSISFISHDQKAFNVYGDYILWDSEKLTNHFYIAALTNGAVVKYGFRFYSYSLENSRITVYANDKAFSAKLLIDCMGYASPLVQLNNAIEILGYYILYGGELLTKKLPPPIAMANILVGKNTSYLEVFPRSNGFAHTIIIKPVAQIDSFSQIKREFNFITKHSHIGQYFESYTSYKELKGIVPVGRISKSAFDRILFFGEAGQIQPTMTSTCLTKLLNYHEQYTAFVTEKVKSDKLKSTDLQKAPQTMNSFSRKFQIEIFREIQKWDSLNFSEFLDLLNCLDSKTLNDFMFDEIHLSQFFDLQKLSRIAKARNFIWIKPLIKSVLQL